MTEVKYLIIGGGAAGTTAAETIRKKDADGSIVIVSDEPYRFYSRIMLSKPNFFLGKIPFENIWLKKEEWYKENNISFFGGKRAASLDPKGKIVVLDDGENIKYEKLLISTGTCARELSVKGADKKGVHSLRVLDDAKHIIDSLKSIKHVIAIGGGFISFEVADLFRLAGIDVTLIIRESYFWEPVLDEDSGRIIEKTLKDAGINILYKSEVKEVFGEDSVEGVILNDGTEIKADAIICGIGVVCKYDWLGTSGIKTNSGILANEYLETSLPDVWTAGDAAEFNDLILEETVKLGNWVNAQEQGRTAGSNMAGDKKPFKFVSFYTTQGLGATIGFVGDVRPDKTREIIIRKYPEGKAIVRFIQMGKELVGATLINKTADLRAIIKIIEQNIDVSEKHKELTDPNFNLLNLIK